jgi:exopolysaccharide biosynthesis WecB/TagA/CpsF family protein
MPYGQRACAIRRLCNVDFVVTDVEGAVERVHMAICRRKAAVFAFCNMHTLNLARRSPNFAGALAKCTVFNDGVGINMASRVLEGVPFPANLNGTDLTPAILSSTKVPLSVFIVGSVPGVAEGAAEALTKLHPKISVVGVSHGYFDARGSISLIEQIRNTHPDLVLVGMGNPLQEQWALELAEVADSVILCVGAFIDFASGRCPRAPSWIRQVRCEWLYRLALEPRRLAGRYLGGSLTFAWAIVTQKALPMLRTPNERLSHKKDVASNSLP